MADSLLTARAAAVDSLVQSRIAAAKARFERFMVGLPERSLQAMVVAAREELVRVEDFERAEEVKCPACGNRAVLSGWEDVRWEIDWDVEGSHGPAYPSGEYPVVTMYPSELICPVCDLRLEGDELGMIGEADPRDVDLTDEEMSAITEERARDYYEDMYRDR